MNVCDGRRRGKHNVRIDCEDVEEVATVKVFVVAGEMQCVPVHVWVRLRAVV